MTDPLSLLKKLTAISSETSNVSGVHKVQKITESHLKHLGFDTYYKDNANGTNQSAPILVGEIEKGTKPFITFITHADTVFPNFGSASVKEGKLFESGAIDCKGGTVVSLLGIEKFLKVNKPNFSLRFVSSPNEELGSEGFIDFFKTLSKDSFLVLGFEPSLDNGSIIAKRRGNLWYDIETTGLEAHSGRAHKEGINAALELCLKLTEIQKLNDYEKDTTINIGHIEGGKDKYNVVCGWANAKLEARFPSWDEHKRLKTKIEKVLNKNILSTQDGKKSAQTKFKITNDCPPLSPIAKTKQYLEQYLKCVQKFEKRKIAVEQAGGAADTNYFSRPNLCLIDGLGASGGGMHTKNEFIVISSLETRSLALAEFLSSSF